MRLDFTKSTRDYITDYVKFADTKAGAVLAIAVTIASVSGSNADKSLDALRVAHTAGKVLAALPALGLIVATFMVLWHSIHALRPRTSHAERSLASFPDIALMSSCQFRDDCIALDEVSIIKEYCKLNRVLAQTAAEKFRAIGDAIWWLRIQLSCAYVLLLVLSYLRY